MALKPKMFYKDFVVDLKAGMVENFTSQNKNFKPFSMLVNDTKIYRADHLLVIIAMSRKRETSFSVLFLYLLNTI